MNVPYTRDGGAPGMDRRPFPASDTILSCRKLPECSGVRGSRLFHQDTDSID